MRTVRHTATVVLTCSIASALAACGPTGIPDAPGQTGGDQSYYDGIVVLGRLHDDAAARIANMDGSITATVTTLDT